MVHMPTDLEIFEESEKAAAVKHTPGPWSVRCDPSHYDSATDIYGPDGNRIAQTCGQTSAEWIPMEANARLIAAAPTMCDYIAKRAAAGDIEAKEILGVIDAGR